MQARVNLFFTWFFIPQTLAMGWVAGVGRVVLELSGFGNFQLRDKPQRPGRNPKTGVEIPISARRVVTFHPSAKLKSLVEKLSRNTTRLIVGNQFQTNLLNYWPRAHSTERFGES